MHGPVWSVKHRVCKQNTGGSAGSGESDPQGLRTTGRSLQGCRHWFCSLFRSLKSPLKPHVDLLANISSPGCNHLFHEGEIGLLHNDLPVSVIFICGHISAGHFLVILRSEPTTGTLIFKTILFTGIPAFKIMIFWRCGILLHHRWPFLVMKIKSSPPLVSYSPRLCC